MSFLQVDRRSVCGQTEADLSSPFAVLLQHGFLSALRLTTLTGQPGHHHTELRQEPGEPSFS